MHNSTDVVKEYY